MGTDDLEGLALRYANFYGPGTSISVDGEIVEMVRRRTLPIIGEGTGVWSFVHIDDAATATTATLDRGSSGIYNVADDEPAPVSASLPELAAAVGAKPPPPRSGLARPPRHRRRGRVDDDADPRRVKLEGQARAGLDASLRELARRLPHRAR